MRKLRCLMILLWGLLFSVTNAKAQIHIGIGLPDVSIGINLPVYPELVQVPNYPVYYAPQMDTNYFFYDGMYWVYHNDTWYASSWYNGPWGAVDPYYVPLYILRVPVRYYRQPPAYFHGWTSSRPPRWGQHWGHGWEQRRSGWNHWNRNAVPAPAPLPVYQRHYSGDRYPQVEQQHRLRNQQYHYQPRNKVVRQHLEQAAPPKKAPGQTERHPVAQPPQTRPAIPQHQQPPRVTAPHQQQPAPHAVPPPQVRPVVPDRQQPSPQRIEQPQQPAPAVREQQRAPTPHKQQEQKPQSRQQPEHGRGQDSDDRGSRGHR